MVSMVPESSTRLCGISLGRLCGKTVNDGVEVDIVFAVVVVVVLVVVVVMVVIVVVVVICASV